MSGRVMLGLVVSNELEPPSIVNPDTGEVIALTEAQPVVIARVLGLLQAEFDATLQVLTDARRMLGAELIERMDRAGEWTVTAPGVKITAPSPTAGTVDWDAERLEQILDELVYEGVLDQAAKLRAVTQRVVLHVDKRGVAALQKIPAVRDAIEPARLVVPQPYRKASVKVDPRAL